MENPTICRAPFQQPAPISLFFSRSDLRPGAQHQSNVVITPSAVCYDAATYSQQQLFVRRAIED